jgi:hypothetical protein
MQGMGQMLKFTVEEANRLEQLRLLVAAEWREFGSYLRYTDAMNIVGLSTLRKAIKLNLVLHFKGGDWIDTCYSAWSAK